MDSSALVKMVLPEPETPALFRLLHDWPDRTSSTLARVEVLRVVRRHSPRPLDLRRAEQVIERLTLIRLDDEILENAARLAPPPLGSLDAIHLATALSLGRDLGALVTYDRVLAAAAASAGAEVLQPG